MGGGREHQVPNFMGEHVDFLLFIYYLLFIIYYLLFIEL